MHCFQAAHRLDKYNSNKLDPNHRRGCIEKDASSLFKLRSFDRFDVFIPKNRRGNVVDSICLATGYRYFI